ncbi:MAG: hypothetical protein OXU63_02960 [Acidobacteriota bacterium]|nr:hypothetical protein [Acidobacteriota bacterium]
MAEPARDSDYATRADLNAAVERLRVEIAGVRTEIAEVRTEIAEVRTEIAATEARLTWRLLGGVAALLTLFRLLDLFPGG